MLPAGIVSAQLGVIGNGVVVDPATLLAEVEQLTEWDRNVLSRIRISRSAHVITADAIKLDNQMRAKELGTTGRGVGPTYAAKVERRGYRIHDLL
jgi:adenylosuccinate synthase